MAITQAATWSIAHHQKRSVTLYAKIQHTYNMRMFQTSNCSCFCTKEFTRSAIYLEVEHFDDSLGTKVNMLAQINHGKAFSPQKTEESIVSHLLIQMIA